MIKLPATAFAGLLLLGHADCDASTPPPAASLGGEARSPRARASSADSASLDPPLGGHRSFVALSEMEHAVVWGELANARERAALLLDQQRGSSHPRGWSDHLPELTSAATELTHASSLAAAASAVANLAAACGGCHRALGSPPEPRGGDAPEARTLRASWAIARLSDGLVHPSPRAWEAGLAALDDAPACHTAEPPPSLEHCMSLGEFSRHAARARTPERRARVYAALLTTCGTCHISKPR